MSDPAAASRARAASRPAPRPRAYAAPNASLPSAAHSSAVRALRCRVDDVQERSVDQRGEEIEDLDGRAVVNSRGAPRRHAAGEEREPFGERALGVGQELPAPVDDGAQCAVARQRSAAAAGEDLKATVQAPGELIGAKRA